MNKKILLLMLLTNLFFMTGCDKEQNDKIVNPGDNTEERETDIKEPDVKEPELPPVIEDSKTLNPEEKLLYEEMYPVEVDPLAIMPLDLLEMDGSTCVGIKDYEAFTMFMTAHDDQLIFPYGITGFLGPIYRELRDEYDVFHLDKLVFPNSVEYFGSHSMQNVLFTEIHFPNNPYIVEGGAFNSANITKVFDLTMAKSIDHGAFGSPAGTIFQEGVTVIFPANLTLLTKYYRPNIEGDTPLNYYHGDGMGIFKGHPIKTMIFRGNGEDVVFEYGDEHFDELSKYFRAYERTDWREYPEILDEICYNSPISQYESGLHYEDVVKYSIVNNYWTSDENLYPNESFDYELFYETNDLPMPSIKNHILESDSLDPNEKYRIVSSPKYPATPLQFYYYKVADDLGLDIEMTDNDKINLKKAKKIEDHPYEYIITVLDWIYIQGLEVEHIPK